MTQEVTLGQLEEYLGYACPNGVVSGYANMRDWPYRTIPPKTTFLGAATFRDNKHIEEIPEGVLFAQYVDFSDCKKLVRISHDFHVRGDASFWGCESLSNIPENGVFGGNVEFMLCRSIREIPPGVMFYGCVKFSHMLHPEFARRHASEFGGEIVAVRCADGVFRAKSTWYGWGTEQQLIDGVIKEHGQPPQSGSIAAQIITLFVAGKTKLSHMDCSAKDISDIESAFKKARLAFPEGSHKQTLPMPPQPKVDDPPTNQPQMPMEVHNSADESDDALREERAALRKLAPCSLWKAEVGDTVICWDEFKGVVTDGEYGWYHHTLVLVESLGPKHESRMFFRDGTAWRAVTSGERYKNARELIYKKTK